MQTLEMVGRQGNRNARGFALAELVAVLGILAALVGMATPTMLQWMHSLKCRSSVQNIFYVLRDSQSKAISSNLEHRVQFDAANGRYRLLRGDKSSNSLNWDTVVYDWMTLPHGVSMSTNRVYIHVNPRGTSSNGKITITDTINSKEYQVVIADTGRIHIL